jgi:hypothetical protein
MASHLAVCSFKIDFIAISIENFGDAEFLFGALIKFVNKIS